VKARDIRRNGKAIAAIIGLMLIALATAAVILPQQRLKLPWDDRYTVSAAFESAKAVTPGQGQTVNVAGISVGEISGVELQDGQAVVEMSMDPEKLPAVYRDATMTLRPRTALEDQTVELIPGTEGAGELTADEVLPIERTTPEVNLDQILSSLDADVQAYLTALLNVGGDGFGETPDELRAALGSVEPVLERGERISAELAKRRAETRRLVHNLAEISTEAASKDDDLRNLISSSQATFAAFADEEQALGESIDRLPDALRSTRLALDEIRPFARTAGPAFERLTQTADLATPALARVRPLVREGRADLAELREFSVRAKPVVSRLDPVVDDLVAATPKLTRTFDVLKYAANELAYVPNDPQNGYLFWASWFGHNGNSFISIQDGNGPAWRLLALAGCDNFLSGLNVSNPVLQALFGQAGLCPPGP
jgi:phospholipid/cholesterol/gamma-HCH transport system substrate-binding protein